MLKSPDNSTVEEVFTSNEIIMNSPFEELIREVSISPTEELLEPKLTSNSSSDHKQKTTKHTTDASKKRIMKDNYPSKKQKLNILTDKVHNLKPTSSSVPYIIKIEPQEKDLPVISIPDMDIVEPEVLVYVYFYFYVGLNNRSISNLCLVCYIVEIL